MRTPGTNHRQNIADVDDTAVIYVLGAHSRCT